MPGASSLVVGNAAQSPSWAGESAHDRQFTAEPAHEPEPFTVNRWRRYGHDRLYVVRADGTTIGWWDLETVEGHPDRPDDATMLDRLPAPGSPVSTSPGGNR